MGLFSSKKKTYRDLSYTRLIDDDYLPDVIGQAITTYVLDEDNTESLTDLMLEYGWESNAVKWNAAYRYALKTGKYYYGVPTTTTVSETDFTGAESLEEVLQTLTGQDDLTYLYSKFGDNNFRHSMYQLLVSNYNYNATTNVLTTLSTSLGVTAYLYDAVTYLTADTTDYSSAFMLEHWGLAPTSGQTDTRTQDFTRVATADGVSTTGANYSQIKYSFTFTGLSRTTTITTTDITTVVKTPNGSGGYDETTTESSSDATSTGFDWNGFVLPPDVISQTEIGTGTTHTTETDPPTTTSTTNPTTGVITEVTTQISRDITKNSLNISAIAYFNMGFGIYDYNPSDEDIDTTTVLDDNDSGNYDPNAVLVPSGEDTTDSSDYFQVCFTYLTTDGVTHIGYFTYQYGSGSYPALDGITSTEVTDFGQSFPRIYFRLNGDRLDTTALSDTDAYKTSVKLAKKLDMDWTEVSDNIYNSLSSLSKIRDVYITQCVPANTENTLEEEYLYNYFKTLYGIRSAMTDADYSVISTSGSGGSETRPTNTEYDLWAAHSGCTIQAKDVSTTNQNAMDAIGFRTITGTIGAKGVTASGRGTGSILVIYSTLEDTTTGSGSSTSVSKKTTYSTTSVSYHYYQYQISDTQYEEVRVYNLSHTVLVGGKGVTKSGDSEYLMVALDHAFRKLFSAHDRETLYARATHVLLCTEYTVKTKWYQTSIFKAVTIVVAVAISWWTGGASLTLIGAVTAVATAIGSMVVFSLLSKYVFSKLGGAFAIIAAVAAIAIAVYSGYVYFAGTTGPYSLTARQMLMASNVAFKASNSAQQGLILKEQQKLATLQDEINSKTDELNDAQDELNQGTNTIQDSVLLRASADYVTLGETATEYYAKALNTNVGIIALYLPEIYLAQTIELPSSVAILAQMQQNMHQPFELDGDLYDL
jgi:hypothetical protein